MTRNDTAIRRATTGIVAAVGLFAGGDSYVHIYDLARAHQQNALSAAFLPLAGDGLVVASSWVMLAAASKGKEIPAAARCWFWGGVFATIAANGAYGLPHGITAALLSLWPVAAYLGCMEMLTWMQQHLGMQPKMHPRTPRVAPVNSQPDASGPPEEDASDELRDRRERRARQPLTDLLKKAEARYPGGRNEIGKFPVLREIQGDLGIGQPKAQQVQAHLKTLQPAILRRTCKSPSPTQARGPCYRYPACRVA